MAKSTIQGLTVAIGADTSKFTKAMKELDAEARAIAKDLKTVNDHLKLDPSNTTKTAESMKLLKEHAEKAGQKVDLIKKAIEKLNDEYAKGNISAEDYNKSLSHLQTLLGQATHEQDLANEKLRQFGEEAENSGKKALSLSDIIKGNLISAAIKTGLQTITNLAKKLAKELAEAGKKLLEFSIDAVKYAAQYQDALGYSERVFGGYAEKMTQWIKDNSTALRIGVSDLQVYANNLGTAFGALGLGHDQMVEFTQNIISLSADIRAATGRDIDDIMGALTRGFTSSTRNLRRFGVFIGEADIKIQALKDGIVEYTGDQEALNQAIEKYAAAAKAAEEALNVYKEESEQFTAAEEAATAAEEELNALLGEQEITLGSSQRTIALYNLIMEKMSFLVGQNAQEAGLYSSQIALLKTQFSNLKLEIGKKLLPVFTDLVTKFNEFLQSDTGQKILASIVEQFEKWGNSLTEMVEDGSIERFFSYMSDALPGVIDGIGEFTDKVIELVPQLIELTEKIFNFLGIETEASRTKKAYKGIKDEVEAMAKAYGTSTDTIRTAAALFAEENGLHLSEVYEDWETYEPKIKDYLDSLNANYEADMINGAQSIIAGFASQNKLSLQEIYSNWETYEPKIKAYAASMGTDYDEQLNTALGYLQSFASENNVSLGTVLSDFQTYEPQFMTWLTQISSDFDATEQAVTESLEALPQNAQASVNKFSEIDYTAFDIATQRVRNFCDDIKQAVLDAIHWIGEFFKATDDVDTSLIDQSTPDWRYGEGSWEPYDSSSVGSVANTGRMVRRSGGTLQAYVPPMETWVGASGPSESMINNNNYSRTISGGINIYVNSYGMDVSEVADELGAAFQAKLRMSGAML